MNYILEGEHLYQTLLSKAKALFIPSRDNQYYPGFLSKKPLVYLVAALIAVKIISVAVYLPWPQNIFFADVTKTDLVSLLNQSRQQLGLTILNESQKLDEAATLKARDMVAKGYFSHQSPDGTTPWFWFTKAGYQYHYAGENLAVGFADSKNIYDAWVASKTHKENLLNSHYTEVGTAILKGFGSNDAIVVVQLFGSPAPAQKPVTASTQTPTDSPTQPAQPLPPPILEIIPEELVLEPQPAAPQEPAENPGQVLAGFDENTTLSKPSANSSNSWYLKFVNFMVYDHETLIRHVSYGLFFVIGLCLLLNIMVNAGIKHPQLALRALALMVVIGLSLIVNENMLLRIIPHQVSI